MVAGEEPLRGDIAVRDDRILAVGVAGAVPADFRPSRTVEAGGHLVLPGLINTHSHAAMNLLRGYADDLPLMPWLTERIFPVEARLTGDDVYWGTGLAILEMIASGTTCFADMYFFMDRVAQMVEDAGMRAFLSRGLIGGAPNGAEALAEGLALAEAWQGRGDGRITVMLGPHAPYTCPPAYLERVVAAAQELGLGIHIHLAETAGEGEEIRRLYGRSPVAHLERLGVFDVPALAAHCVHLDAADIGILAEKGVGVAHNPVSNLKLGSGIAPLLALRRAGVAVGLGSDGAASTNTLDLFQEIKLAAWLAKGTSGDPAAFGARQALELATVGGAAVLGRAGELGQVRPGFLADLIVLSTDRPHLTPAHDLYSLAAYAATGGDVETVIIAGRVVYSGGEYHTLDRERILREGRTRAAALVGNG